MMLKGKSPIDVSYFIQLLRSRRKDSSDEETRRPVESESDGFDDEWMSQLRSTDIYEETYRIPHVSPLSFLSK